MSLSGGEPQSFFGPLMGKTTTFMLEGRQANLAFARMMAGFLAQTRSPCAILDLDAFYSSNSDLILSSMDADTAASTIIRVPEPGSDVEIELATLFEAQHRVIIIDSLNSLYHLVSLEDGSSRGRKLTFALASLSYLARTNGKAVILSMYRREGLFRARSGRSISNLSDATALVDVRERELKIRSERGPAWPGGVFFSRIPSV
jgi:hypothetical protein